MRLLVIHQNFPGQFKHLVQAWAKTPGWEVLGMGRDTARGLPPESGVPWIKYKLQRQPQAEQHHYLRNMEGAVLHGQAVVRVLMSLKHKGYKPDVILAHPGWGETLYVKDVFPDVRLVHLCEWYYAQPGSDLNFDPEFPTSFDTITKLKTWNALHLQNLDNCDAAVTPTRWQWQQHPQTYRNKIQIVHEGIDTVNLRPNPHAVLKLPSGQVVKAGDPVITYVARNLEPYRGFHIFMRALEKIQRRHPTCHAVIVGGDDVSYGSKPHDAPNWRERMLREVTLDPARTHFLGKVPYPVYKTVLQVSAVHTYLSYPFVLSWSMLEALACGCHVIASDTAPVRELALHPQSGQLLQFFEVETWATRITDALANRAELGHQAKRHADEWAAQFDKQNGLNIYTKTLVGQEFVAEFKVKEDAVGGSWHSMSRKTAAA